MKNFINNIRIKNYKSIKDISLDLSRVNLLIGRTNSGKTNIIEAMSLLGKSSDIKFYKDILNYNNIEYLFHFYNIEEKIEIITDRHYVSLENIENSNDFKFFQNLFSNENFEEELFDVYNSRDFLSLFYDTNNEPHDEKYSSIADKIFLSKINENFLDVSQSIDYTVKNYKFSNNEFNENKNKFLMPPDGKNLFKIISVFKSIRDDLTRYLDGYNLEIVFNPNSNEFFIQRREDNFVYQLPFDLLADTLQRAIFYIAAIKSNSNSTILFEEPEVHSYPPYILDLAQEILDAEKNQFIISTHSPYLFEKIVESGKDDISVFIVDYKNFETKVLKLDNNDIDDLLSFKEDIFLNLSQFSERF